MKKWFTYLILLVVTGYTAILYLSTAGVLLLSVEIVLALLLWLVLISHIRGIKTRILTGTRIFDHNSAIEVPVKIENKSPFPILKIKLQFLVQNKTKNKSKVIPLTLALDGKSSIREGLALGQQASGLLEIRLKKIFLFDLLGFFHFSKKEKWYEEIVVMPRQLTANIMVRGGALPITGDGERYHDSLGGDDRSHVVDFREYQPGDRMQSIHWKASLKKDSLLVKIPGKPLGGGIYFILEQDGITDAFLEAVFAVGAALCVQQFYFTLLWYSNLEQVLIPIEVLSEEEFYLAMEQLMRHGVAAYKIEDPDIRRISICLDKELRLYYKEQLVAELAEGDLEQNLIGMELIL